MLNIIIFAGIFLLMLGFVAGAEKVCDWYWGRKRRIPRAARNDRKEARYEG